MKSVLSVRCRAMLVAATLGVCASAPLAQSTTAPTTAPSTQPASTRNGNRAATGVVPGEGGLIAINFQDASIDVILDELSTAAGFIVVKEVKPEGRVTLVSKQPIRPDEAISLLNTVLRKAGSGYVAIQQGRVLKIVNAADAKRMNIPVRTGSDPAQIAESDELITQVIPLKYADATQLKQDLEPLVNPQADFASNASSNALVMTDTSANVRRVVQIVSALDTSVANAVNVKVFQLKYANAASAAALINSVFGNLDIGVADGSGEGRPNLGGGNGNRGGGGNGGGNNFGGGGQGNFGGGGGGREFAQRMQQMQRAMGGGNTGNKITASADDRTNSVVVAGPAETLTIVGTVIKDLDSNPAIDEQVFVYRLKNSQSVNLESVLNSLFNGTSVNRSNTTGTNTSNRFGGTATNRTGTRNNNNNTNTRGGNNAFGGGTGGGGNANRGGLGGNNTNTANGNRFGGNNNGNGLAGRNFSQGASQAASDLAGQVSIIADTDTNSLLVRTSPSNYDRVKKVLDELDAPVKQVLIKVLIAEVTHDNSLDYGAELSVLNLRAGTNQLGDSPLGSIGGSNFGIPANGAGLVVQLLENNFTATIRALETQGKLDVLSRPYILASDNQAANITVGQEVPFVTNSRITDLGQTINTIEYGDVGILLDVMPHINPDGLVILDVAPEISTLTGSTVAISELVNAPIIAKRSAQSRVAVMSGQTVVIGGLMEDRVNSQILKVPILGDIPLIGELFRRTQKNKVKTELLIFLTPHVVAEPTKLAPMADDELRGTQLVPRAVEAGTFQQHIDGLKRGQGYAPGQTPPTTGPALAPLAPPVIDRDPREPEPRR